MMCDSQLLMYVYSYLAVVIVGTGQVLFPKTTNVYT